MSSSTTSRDDGATPEETSINSASTKHHDDYEEEEETTLFKTVGWISAGLGAVALGLFIGRELRQRYQFNRRTPYDFYAHSGDEQDVDFGIGI
ncbi:MAG TPA: hypothetical protein VNU92_02575 [Edaphobacter sp.]|nr:hypothetical protein [Edaphobacter sp.]